MAIKILILMFNAFRNIIGTSNSFCCPAIFYSDLSSSGSWSLSERILAGTGTNCPHRQFHLLPFFIPMGNFVFYISDLHLLSLWEETGATRKKCRQDGTCPKVLLLCWKLTIINHFFLYKNVFFIVKEYCNPDKSSYDVSVVGAALT